MKRKRNVRRALTLTIVSIISFFLGGLFLYQTKAQLSVYEPDEIALSGVASNLSPKAEAAQDIPPVEDEPMRELHIANNGLVLLRGARVISVSREVIRVGTVWDSAVFAWEIRTKPFSTGFITSKGKKGALVDIKKGDVLTVTGQLIKGGLEPIIEAQFVRE